MQIGHANTHKPITIFEAVVYNKVMGVMEQQAGQREKRMRIQRALAVTLFRLTTQNPRLSFATTQELVKHLKLDPGPTVTRRVHQAYQRMEQKGLLERKYENGKLTVSLTVKGQHIAERLDAADSIVPKQPGHWDGKWRVVIFDVWEYRRGMRDKLRKMLIKAGFLKLQNSVWVYPYDCEDLFVFVRSDLHLGKSMLYMIVESIENDAHLRDHFGL